MLTDCPPPGDLVLKSWLLLMALLRSIVDSVSDRLLFGKVCALGTLVEDTMRSL